MARFERYRHGQFSWVDLMTPDPDAAASFYGELFGWDADATQDDGGGAYTMFRLGDATVAGMGAMPDEMQKAGVPAHWNSYVTVDDADSARARAAELGATPQMPVIDIAVGGELVGRMTSFADPGGARLSVWQAGNHVGSRLANVPGSFCWNELCSRDPDASARFYSALFGWDVRPPDGDNGYREIHLGNRSNGGILPWQPDMGDMPPAWTPYLTVEDCAAGIEKVKALGGTVLMGPIAIEPGSFAVVADRQGAVFNIMSLIAPDGDPEP